jgi:hypothetical protein
VIITSRIPECS